MTFLQKLLGQTPSLSLDEERYWSGVSSAKTASGMPVSADGALKISTAWACTRLISETVAMLPRIVYERMGDGGKERATGHPLYYRLHDQPNRRQTSFEFVEMLQMHALLRGSGFAKIRPGPRGPVDTLLPIHPDRVKVEEVDEDVVRYVVTEKDGSKNTYTDDEIFELRGLSLDGTNTVSVISYARESFGLTLAAERFGAKLFANFSRPGGFLKHPGHLSEDAQKRLARQTEDMTGGENLYRLGVLEEGMEWQPVTFSPEDTQMLQTREFQAEDVCRWFRVPPHMVGLTSKSTSWGSGIEELSRGFVTYVLMPWLVRWQQAISKDLIIASDKYFVEFLTEALLRGDIAKRYNAYSIGRQWGWLDTNEIRRWENLNPVKGGDNDRLHPLNMRRWDEPVAPPPAKEPPAAKPEPTEPQKESGQAHYQQLLQENAARVVRKEIAALTRIAKRTEGDPAAYTAAAGEFFTDHVEFVAQTMQMERGRANRYCLALAFADLAEIVSSETQRVADLVALAMEAA